MKNLNSALFLALLSIGIGCLKVNKSNNIEVNTFTSNEHVFVELKQLEGFSKAKRVEFINGLIAKYGDSLIDFNNIDQGSEKIDRLV